MTEELRKAVEAHRAAHKAWQTTSSQEARWDREETLFAVKKLLTTDAYFRLLDALAAERTAREKAEARCEDLAAAVQERDDLLDSERGSRAKAEAEYREAISDRHDADANEKKMYYQWRDAETRAEKAEAELRTVVEREAETVKIGFDLQAALSASQEEVKRLRSALTGGRTKLATYVSVYTGDKELRRLLADWDAILQEAPHAAE